MKAKAEEVLKQAKGGADFAELAKKYSEDESNAKNGGDLDYFGRGRMVQEFDTAAFSMEPGQISDLVKSQFGYPHHQGHGQEAGHHEAARGSEAAAHRPDPVRARAAQAGDIAQKLEAQIKTPADLDTAARAQGLTVQETGFFARTSRFSVSARRPR